MTKTDSTKLHMGLAESKQKHRQMPLQIKVKTNSFNLKNNHPAQSAGVFLKLHENQNKLKTLPTTPGITRIVSPVSALATASPIDV